MTRSSDGRSGPLTDDSVGPPVNAMQQAARSGGGLSHGRPGGPGLAAANGGTPGAGPSVAAPGQRAGDPVGKLKPTSAKGKFNNNSDQSNGGQPQSHQRAAGGKLPSRSPARRSRTGGNRDRNIYCALDLGTNNCRLLVARPSRRGFSVIDAFSRIIRLGEGVTLNGELSQEAMSRTKDALKVCAAKMMRNQVERSRLVATEACRVAANGEAFLDEVRRDLGLDIEILSRENEAKLAVSGCASLIDGDSDLALVFDIGGGSSELIWIDLAQRRQIWQRSLAERLEAQNCIKAWTSLPVGVVTLAERFGGQYVDEEVFERMVAHVMDLLAPFEAKYELRDQVAKLRTHMLGTSGTVTTVAGVHLGLARYDRHAIDGCWLDIEQVKEVTARLLAYDHQQRVASPCIGRDRADLVLAGCAILEALIRMWPCQRLRVADRGLREGMLAHLMAEDGFYRAGQQRRRTRR